MYKDRQLDLFGFKIKKVTLDDLRNNKSFGCMKCKYEKVCSYCGLDWTGITKSMDLKIQEEEIKSINVEEAFSVEGVELENSDVAEHFYLLAKKIDNDIKDKDIKYTALEKLLALKNDII